MTASQFCGKLVSHLSGLNSVHQIAGQGAVAHLKQQKDAVESYDCKAIEGNGMLVSQACRITQ